MSVKICLTSENKRRLMVTESRVLRRMFVSKIVEGHQRELCSDDPHNWHSSPNILKVIKKDGQSNNGPSGTYKVVQI